MKVPGPRISRPEGPLRQGPGGVRKLNCLRCFWGPGENRNMPGLQPGDEGAIPSDSTSFMGWPIGEAVGCKPIEAGSIPAPMFLAVAQWQSTQDGRGFSRRERDPSRPGPGYCGSAVRFRPASFALVAQAAERRTCNALTGVRFLAGADFFGSSGASS